MAFYTTEVRHICETYAGLEESVDRLGVHEVIGKAIPKIFDFDFPMFDENYRSVLQAKILMHYYTREIGEETVGLWKLRLETKLNEIMPYYNKLYESELLKFDPFRDMDYTVDHKGNSQSENQGTSNGLNQNYYGSDRVVENETDDAYSDTPQGKLSGVRDDIYLTQYRRTKSDTTDGVTGNSTTNTLNNTTDNGSTTDAYLNHIFGKTSGVSYSKLLEEYRKTFLNIDMEIIKDLGDLFMNVWA